MSRQVSRGSAGEYQADEQAGVGVYILQCVWSDSINENQYNIVIKSTGF